MHSSAVRAPDAAAASDRGPRSDAPYRLVSRDSDPRFRGNSAAREVAVGDVVFGRGKPILIAGPCAVESREQTLRIARGVRDAGGDLLRGGAYKPRTSPHAFQGLGRAGLEILAEARAETGLPVVTEVMDPRLVETVGAVADVLQVGSRNMQNFPLLVEVGKFGKPVLLKRGSASTLEEWLCAAEYVAAEGNLDVILCERGIRTFSQGDYNRNTLDLNVVPALRRETFLPIVVDPSHGTGVASLVEPASLAALAAGAHGLIIEVIAEDTDPDDCLCDGFQSIPPSVLGRIADRARDGRAREPGSC
jgi:3-deoxy-7-phosphoheptulonate synthase